MNESQVYKLLIGRDRSRYLASGIAGFLLVVIAALVDIAGHHRLLAILIGLPGLILLFDHLRRRGREPLAHRATAEPQSVISAHSDATTPLLLRFDDGYALAPNISAAEAPQIVAWLHSRNPKLQINCPTFEVTR